MTETSKPSVAPPVVSGGSKILAWGNRNRSFARHPTIAGPRPSSECFGTFATDRCPTAPGSSQAPGNKGRRPFAYERNTPYSLEVREVSEDEPGRDRLEGDRLARSKALVLLRAYRGFSQRRLEAATGINKATISGYETGRLEIGQANLVRMLEGLGWNRRAWEATLRHVEWLEWLFARDRGSPDEVETIASGSAPAPGSPSELTEIGGLRREIERIAELAGRDKERRISTLLEAVARLLT